MHFYTTKPLVNCRLCQCVFLSASCCATCVHILCEWYYKMDLESTFTNGKRTALIKFDARVDEPVNDDCTALDGARQLRLLYCRLIVCSYGICIPSCARKTLLHTALTHSTYCSNLAMQLTLLTFRTLREHLLQTTNVTLNLHHSSFGLIHMRTLFLLAQSSTVRR